MLFIPDTQWFITSYSEYVELVEPGQNSKRYQHIVMDLKAAAKSEVKLVVKIVFKGWQLRTILTESSILDLASPVPQNGAFYAYGKQFQNSFVFGWVLFR